jgi:hypothetical protein
MAAFLTGPSELQAVMSETLQTIELPQAANFYHQGHYSESQEKNSSS